MGKIMVNFDVFFKKKYLFDSYTIHFLFFSLTADVVEW